eukprot:TRINITY_DN11844_c0_g1_i1.p1 TRINITY_DN11844_c0_g1~~TRINITY_DN11844_c0_g1_i1.p1  ORF type:complete len:190 (+),score=7.13 TRINITY_DN11844_c0_g1_i1:29-571(+)
MDVSARKRGLPAVHNGWSQDRPMESPESRSQHSTASDGHLKVLTVLTVLITISAFFYAVFHINRNTDGPGLSIPTDIASLKLLKHTFHSLIEENFFYVALSFTTFYLLKHTFSLPGSAILNVLAGDIFGVTVGFSLACFCTAVGASMCYWLSYSFGRTFFRRMFARKLDALSRRVRSRIT